MNRHAPSGLTSEASKAVIDFEPPGGILVWLIVFVELVTFGAGLGVFLWEARTYGGEFASGRALLNQPLALINTLRLLTGGWCMANGLLTLRRAASTTARR